MLCEAAQQKQGLARLVKHIGEKRDERIARSRNGVGPKGPAPASPEELARLGVVNFHAQACGPR